MPTYAILGGTGNTGGELVELLARSPDSVLHVYARSRDKLLKAHPVLADAKSPHKIFTGDLGNTDLFAECLHATDAVFSVVGTNANNPEVRLAQDSAATIIAALSKLKSASIPSRSFKPPTVVLLTSAGMTSDRRVRANFPNHIHRMLQLVGKYVYHDFRQATALLQRPENAWIPVIFFCAPGLMPGPSQGKVQVGYNIPQDAPIWVTYTDLARGMTQAAIEGNDWIHKEIGIVGAKMPPVDYGIMMYYFITGLMCVLAPPLWRFGHRKGWWGDK